MSTVAFHLFEMTLLDFTMFYLDQLEILKKNLLLDTSHPLVTSSSPFCTTSLWEQHPSLLSPSPPPFQHPQGPGALLPFSLAIASCFLGDLSVLLCSEVPSWVPAGAVQRSLGPLQSHLYVCDFVCGRVPSIFILNHSLFFPTILVSSRIAYPTASGTVALLG